jgi:hypothetical protein
VNHSVIDVEVALATGIEEHVLRVFFAADNIGIMCPSNRLQLQLVFA